MAGAKVAYAINHWPVAIASHSANHPGVRHFCARIDHVDIRQMRDVTLLLASPECTSHSLARGNREPDEQSRATAFEVLRFADLVRPPFLVVENVVEFTRWALYPIWRAGLETLGYHLREEVLNAADFGAPTTRTRLFVVGAQGMDPPKVEPPTNVRRVSAREVIDIEAWPFTPVAEKAPRTRERVAAIRRKVGDKPFLLTYYGSGGYQTLDRPLRTVTARDRFALVVPGPRGPQMRMLQPPELARGMGFPDSYVLEGSRQDKVRQLGNAVSPPVMEGIVSSLQAVA